MKKYIGTKEVQAEPMNEFKAVELGYARPNTDNHEWRGGYHVVYPDGYHSWSPKNVFESSYKCSETFLDRLQIELEELRERYTKLCQYLDSSSFDELSYISKKLLIRQSMIMDLYIETLEARIADIMEQEENKCSC